MAKNNGTRNNYQQAGNGTKSITTVKQNSFDNEIENDLFSGDLGEYLLFGSEEEQLSTYNNGDILNCNKEEDRSIDVDDPDDDILTEGGGTDLDAFHSREQEVELIFNEIIDKIIDKIQLNGESFDLDMSKEGLSNKFNFDSSTGILFCNGRETLIINSYDGSVEIATDS